MPRKYSFRGGDTDVAIVDVGIFQQADGVEHARVEAVPPFAFTVRLGQIAVVRHARLRAGLIAAKSGLIPPPGVFVMERNAKTHSRFLGSDGPFAEQITVWTKVHGIPRLEMGIPIIEIVVMNALDNQKTRAGIMISLDEFGWIQTFWIPITQHILVTNFRRMSVIFQVVRVGRLRGIVEFPRIPVAALAGGLRTEMNPDAKLRVPQPRRTAGIIGIDRIPSRRKRSSGDGKIHFNFREVFGITE